jgi:murein DD-endopeptidase MepM/ murein hydrolase activator NlpD
MESDPKQTIGGLSFKDFGESLESGDNPEDFSLDPSKSKIVRFFQKIRSFLAKGTSIFSFLYDFTVYIRVRMRILGIILSVLVEVVMEYFDSTKRFAVKHMFWGRGGVFKFFVQFVGLVLFALVFTVYAYRASEIQADYIGATNVGTNIAREDLLVQTGQTSTPVPENRGRTESDVYVVKSGDTLSSIASFYNITTDTLRWVNDLSEVALIRPGDELTVPPGDGVLVKVQDGDTLEKLAEKYSSNPQLIIENEYNYAYISYPDYKLTAGTEIFIPDGRPPEPAKPVYTPPTYSGITYNPPANSSTVSASRFLRWPVAGGTGRLTQCFSGWHNGIDIASYGNGFPDVVAAANGTVTFAGCQSGSCPGAGFTKGGYGLAWAVIIDHGNGLQSVYGHLNRIYVRSGQSVSGGQAIGQMGESGTAYGVHVHFMLLRGGWSWTNPAPYMTTSLCGY